jgi:hypothetical protein
LGDWRPLGVYGASNFLYSPSGSTAVDHTPVLSSDIANGGTAKNPTPVVGGIGVVGAGYKAPGVVATAALTDAEASSSTVGTGVISSIVQTPVGVVGMVATPPEVDSHGITFGCAGVMGMSLNDMPANTLKSPLDLGVDAVLQDAQGTIATPGFGMGVFGWSFRGRGGVFASASPIPPTATTTPKNILDLASAQIRLVPAPVSPANARRLGYTTTATNRRAGRSYGGDPDERRRRYANTAMPKFSSAA